jgi:hypothetical protein
MATVRIYRCTDNTCRFMVHLGKEFPLWHPETPASMKLVPVPAAAREYVVGHRSESFCRYCKKTVESNADMTCPRCSRSGMYEEEGGRACPQCLSGTLSIQHQSVL